MKKLFVISMVCILGSFLIMASGTQATPIYVANYSFEDNSFSDPGDYSSTGITGWTVTNAAGAWKPYTNSYYVPLPDGENLGYANEGSLSQTVGTLSFGSYYTLTVDIGWRDNYNETWPAYSVGLYDLTALTMLAEETQITPSKGYFTEVAIEYLMDNIDLAGHSYQIVLSSADKQVNFDNVRLASPEPSTMLLLGFGLVGLFAGFRRKA